MLNDVISLYSNRRSLTLLIAMEPKDYQVELKHETLTCDYQCHTGLYLQHLPIVVCNPTSLYSPTEVCFVVSYHRMYYNPSFFQPLAITKYFKWYNINTSFVVCV